MIARQPNPNNYSPFGQNQQIYAAPSPSCSIQGPLACYVRHSADSALSGIRIQRALESTQRELWARTQTTLEGTHTEGMGEHIHRGQ